jgi:phage tail tube protein FII
MQTLALLHHGCEINDLVVDQNAKEQNLATGVVMITKDIRKGSTKTNEKAELGLELTIPYHDLSVRNPNRIGNQHEWTQDLTFAISEFDHCFECLLI